MRSKQPTQEQEEYLRFDRHRTATNRFMLILFVVLLISVAVSWHLVNTTYVPSLIITGVFLVYSVGAYFYTKNTKKKHDLLYAAAYGASVEVAHDGLYGELWEEFEYNQFEGLTDGKVTHAATGSESIELNILRKKREYIIEIDSKTLYMIVDEETDIPIEKEIPLSDFADTVVGNARVIRDALPNATFVGFTGTPISAKDRNTREVFGEYIDIYDMTQAVEDGATRPVYYESRVVHLKLDQNVLELIDATYDAIEQQSDSYTIEKSKKMLGQMESVLGADSTIDSLVNDILVHYEKHRANLLTGKAMIVLSNLFHFITEVAIVSLEASKISSTVLEQFTEHFLYRCTAALNAREDLLHNLVIHRLILIQ